MEKPKEKLRPSKISSKLLQKVTYKENLVTQWTGTYLRAVHTTDGLFKGYCQALKVLAHSRQTLVRGLQRRTSINLRVIARQNKVLARSKQMSIRGLQRQKGVSPRVIARQKDNLALSGRKSVRRLCKQTGSNSRVVARSNGQVHMSWLMIIY